MDILSGLNSAKNGLGDADQAFRGTTHSQPDPANPGGDPIVSGMTDDEYKDQVAVQELETKVGALITKYTPK